MAVGFRRTLTSLASPKSVAPSFLLDCARPRKLAYARVRSTSLPVRLHPLAAALHDAARALLAWADAPARTGPAWVADGAGRAGRVLAGLADLLHHPQARDALRRHPWTEQLLDDLLLLADLHGSFRESLVALRQLLAETHAVLRRRGGARLAAALQAQRRSAREVSRLASAAPLPPRGARRGHARRRLRSRDGRRVRGLVRGLRRRVGRVCRVRRQRRAVPADADALHPVLRAC